jgi:WD40 repeat protein
MRCMADVFISYSRKDADFVHRLTDALAARSRDVWVDWEDIPASADWWSEVTNGIASANAFVFIISPDSVRSEVCRREIDQAITDNKRFIPLLRRDVDDPTDKALIPPVISSHNWIFFRDGDDFEKGITQLLEAVDTDLSYVRQHTRLLVRAREWDSNGRANDYLLQGNDLREAETWLAEGLNKRPSPAPLQAEYIAASRRITIIRQRNFIIGVSVALLVAIVLAGLSFILFGEANRQRGFAEANYQTATIAQGEAEVQRNIAFQNATLAFQNAATATIALGEAVIQRNNAYQNATLAFQNAATATVALGEAQIQRNIAQQQATAVSEERDRAQSIALAGQASLELSNQRSQRGTLLALLALQNYTYTWQAERALGEAVDGQLTRLVLNGGDGEVTSVAWSPDSARVVTAGNDGRAHVWDAVTGQEQFALQHDKAITRALWSPDGQRIATSSADGTAKIWDAADGKLLFDLTGHTGIVTSVTWSPDSTRVATSSADKTARIWDATNGALLYSLTGHTATVNSIVWSPIGNWVVTASVDKTAKVWNVNTGKLVATMNGHTGEVIRAVWSPDGQRVATASADNTARVWDAESGAPMFTLYGHTGSVTRVLWSPDASRIATISNDNNAKIWDAASGQLQVTLFGHTDDVTGEAWSPDSKRLVTVGQDQVVRVWSADEGAQLITYLGHNANIYTVAWSPDGTKLATASADKTGRVWGIWKDIPSLIQLAQGCCVTRVLTDEESSQFGLPTPTALPPPADIVSCPDALPSRLYPGARGQVSDEDDSALNVRRGPGRGFNMTNQISPNQTFRVLEGPTCAEGFAWFRIIYGISAASGWVAESGDGKYFTKLADTYTPAQFGAG